MIRAMSSRGFLVPPSAAEVAMMPLVRLMRGRALFLGQDIFDRLFCELLGRDSTDPPADAARLLQEWMADPSLAAAVTDEYEGALAAALAQVQLGSESAPLRAIWAAATPAQESCVRALAMFLKAAFTKSRFPRLNAVIDGSATPAQARAADGNYRVGTLMAVDHDVTWGHMKRPDAVARVKWK